MIAPDVPNFVINPENIRAALNTLSGLTLIGGGFGAATSAATVGCYELIRQRIMPDEDDFEGRIRFANTAMAFGGTLGAVGTAIAALMFSR